MKMKTIRIRAPLKRPTIILIINLWEAVFSPSIKFSLSKKIKTSRIEKSSETSLYSYKPNQPSSSSDPIVFTLSYRLRPFFLLCISMLHCISNLPRILGQHFSLKREIQGIQLFVLRFTEPLLLIGRLFQPWSQASRVWLYKIYWAKPTVILSIISRRHCRSCGAYQ